MTYGLRRIGDAAAELCDECGFDSRQRREEEGALARAFDAMARLQLDPNAGRRPQQETWSAVEYAQHTAAVTRELVRLVAEAVDQPVPPLQGPDLTSLGAVVEAFAASLPAAERRLEVAVVEWPFTITVQGAVQHLLHDVEHHVLDVRRGLAKLALSDATEIFTVTRP